MKDELAEIAATPNLSALHEEYQRSTSLLLRDRQVLAEHTRFAYWESQADDGKKWDSNMPEGKRAFPFNGASDSRIRLADEIIQDNVDTLKASFKRAQFVAEGIGAEDAARAGATTKRLDWARNAGIPDLDDEHELLEQYVETYGWGVLHIIWERRLAKRTEEIGMDELVQLSAQIREEDPGNPAVDFPLLIADEGLEENAAEVARGLYPGFVIRQSPEVHPHEIVPLGKKESRKIVKQLRESGRAQFPVPYVSSNNPRVTALRPYEEVFFPPETTDIERARVIFRVDWLTEAELRARVVTDGWNEAWVEKVIKTSQGLTSPFRSVSLRQSSTATVYDLQTNEKEYLHEVVWAYTRGTKDGAECVYCTTFGPHVDFTDNDKSTYGSHVLLNYAHGKYPFKAKTRERTGRRLVDSRGVPEITMTQQNVIKSQIDALVDRTSISISPPLKVPLRNIGKVYHLAPMQQVGVTRPDEIEWMEPPRSNASEALEVMRSVKDGVDEFFGRSSENVPPVKTQVRQQNMVDCDLSFWVGVFKQVDALMLQFMPDDHLVRICGAPGGAGDFSEIQRQVDWKLRFDVRELDTEFMTAKLKAFTDFVLQADRAGVVDMAATVELMANMIDPTIRRAVVTTPQAASQKLYEQVLTDVMAMSQGNEVPYVENDPTAGRQLEFAQKIIAANPKYQEQIAVDEQFGELLQKYQQNRQQSVMQQQNAMVGRLGVAPSQPQMTY